MSYWARSPGVGAVSTLADDAMRAMGIHTSRRCAVALAAGRVVLGVVAVLRPALPARPWVGAADAAGPAGQVLGRALGGRDISLGVGALLALRDEGAGATVAAWVAAGALADGVDALATLVSWPALPLVGRIGVTGVAGGAAVLGVLAAATLRAR